MTKLPQPTAIWSEQQEVGDVNLGCLLCLNGVPPLGSCIVMYKGTSYCWMHAHEVVGNDIDREYQ